MCRDAAQAEALYRALVPEASFSRRFSLRIAREGEKVIMHVSAPTHTALRAFLNSYLRWVHLVHNLLNNVGQKR